jgi:hypothetical protein
MNLDPILTDEALGDDAFRWVEQALERKHATPADGAVLFPTLVPGLLVSDLNVCENYQCRCGWNVTLTGRDPVRRARLAALAERPADNTYGAFKILGASDGPKLWTVRVAGTDDYGLDALVALMLAPID